MNTRRTTLLIAVILAIGTGWLTLTYISSLRPKEGGPPRQVLVANADIPAREHITAALFHTEMKPPSAIQPGAISDPTQAVGSLALVTIPAGSQLTTSQVGTNAALALPVRLQLGMRAVSIPIDRVKGVSGLVQPGDRVDVIAIPPKVGDTPPKAATILRGIRVLAVGNALEYPSATPSPEEQGASTVTLEVNPKQADLLAWADSDTNLRLALRSPKEPIRSEPTELVSFGSTQMLPPSLPPPGPVPPVFAAPPGLGAPAGPPRPLWGPVEVIDGDKILGSAPN